MHIILGEENIRELEEKYTVLELDTFKMISGQEVKAYCLVENLPVDELVKVAESKELHEGLIRNYQKKNWDYCEQAIEHLRSRWNGELDTFYDIMLGRITQYRDKDPGPDWTGVL